MSDKGTTWLQKHNIKIKQRSAKGTIWLQKHNIKIDTKTQHQDKAKV